MILPQIDSLLVQCDEEFSLLRFQWMNAADSRLVSAMNHSLSLIQEYQPTNVLIDLNKLPNLTIENQLRLAMKWFPKVVGSPVKHMALVLSADSAYNQMTIETILWTNRHLIHFDIQFFSDTLTGLEWLADSTSHAAALELEWRDALSNHLLEKGIYR